MIKNSKESVEKIRFYKLNDEEFLAFIDVVSLFTKMPVSLVLEVAEQRLCNGSTLNDRTEVNVSNIIFALKLCLEELI